MKINEKIFSPDCEMQAIRDGFGRGLIAAARSDVRVVGLYADLLESTRMEGFAKEFPDRAIEVGIAEQNLASLASGMAAMGKIPFISSYAMFSPGRNWEQIRTTICYNDRPVKIAGSHAGVSVGPDGGTHQAIEDIAITRVIPRMVVISPCDTIEAEKATIAAARTAQPTYIRLAREKTPIITTQETPFEIGVAQTLFAPPDGKAEVAIIATGALLAEALSAAYTLSQNEHIRVKVLNLSTIEPLDKKSILEVAQETGRIVTVEEHQRVGGMGSAVAELLAAQLPTPIEFVGIDDEFGQSGKPDELIAHFGLNESSIREAVKRVLARS